MSDNIFLQELSLDIKKEYNIKVEYITNELSMLSFNDLKDLSINKVYIIKKDLIENIKPNAKLYNDCEFMILYNKSEYYLSNNYNIKTLLQKNSSCVECSNDKLKCYNKCPSCNFSSCTKCKYDMYIKEYIITNKVHCPWCCGYFVKPDNNNIVEKIKLILQDLYLSVQMNIITRIEFAECERDLQLILSKNKLIPKIEYMMLRYNIIKQ